MAITRIGNVFQTTFINPLKEFIHDSRAIGIILLVCTFISLIIANIPDVGEQYLTLWNTAIPYAHDVHLPHSVLHFINDGLMAVFFFMAGMEIKREMMEGELSSLKKSLLPVAGAVGGMLMPALIFTLFNKGTIFQHGWAIPTATDIAFSLGVASLLGKRVPVGLKIFLTALAIIDDLGAILVIALFYGGQIKFIFLGGCVLVLTIMHYLPKWKIQSTLFHLFLGILLWYFMFNSGIHATVAGVLAAFTIPVHKLKEYEIKHHNLVYFIILPIFALANTAIMIPEQGFSVLTTLLSFGIILGLVIGKPLGICLACWIMVQKKWAQLPANTNWRKMIGSGLLAGIGFTMSIFISTLAFTDVWSQDVSKLAVLVASFIAIGGAILWFKIICNPILVKDEEIPSE